MRLREIFVGEGSPGRVENQEFLHRIISSPRDYDPSTGTILARPFEKVFANGLSVWRPIGNDQDLQRLLEEAISRGPNDPAKQVFAICEVSARDVRELEGRDGERLFCVYDQTVQRTDPALAPVPTHGSIFLRVPNPGTPDGRKIKKDYAGKLRDKFLEKQLTLADYRGGFCESLNARARAGDFVHK